MIAGLLDQVMDPEIPVLTIADLGILRGFDVAGSEVTVTITPTYSGCPAMDMIRSEIVRVLGESGLTATVRTVYAPPWTPDMITREGRAKLARIGIAPPGPPSEVRCPRCFRGSPRVVSEFGSTACKALMVCSNCLEPFDFFKELK